MRESRCFRLSDLEAFKKALLVWSKHFETVSFLDSNGFKDDYSSFEAILAVGAKSSLVTNSASAFEELSRFKTTTKDWIFGYLSYDLKNELEDLSSENYDGLGFQKLYFFQPKKIIRLTNGTIEFLYVKECKHEIHDDYKTINNLMGKPDSGHSPNERLKIKLRIHKDAYLSKVKQALEHIQKGNIYEMNLCQEFFVEQATIDPILTFFKLNQISKPPFATFMKLADRYLICASPERYLKRQGHKVISQPIKGTAARSKNVSLDEKLKAQLRADLKERSENVMIVDLVRNDLSKSAQKGSVLVKELCMVHTFRQVHQMISTITSTVDSSLDSVTLLKDTFPMGSMTGAPKCSAMKIIETLEETKRGLYSGAVGYFDPDDNFDFNVVIRSILYNETTKYVSYSVGGAITANSVPIKEYEECVLKAKAMRSVLEST